MASVPGSRQCIAHWSTPDGRWHSCSKSTPHRGGRHQCACGSEPPDYVQSGRRFHDGRQSFLHLASKGMFACGPKGRGGAEEDWWDQGGQVPR